jgi:iron complex outermembrane receptor protein
MELERFGNIQVFRRQRSTDYVLSNSGNREANFSGDVKFTGKYDISGYSFTILRLVF